MESSENQETGPDAANSTEESDNAPLDQTSTDSQSAQDASTAADEPSGMETAQATSAGASNPWYPVVGATEPVTSAIEPVSGSEIPVSSSDAPEATTIPAMAPEPPEPPAVATAGPVWPTETQTPASADIETVGPAETAGDAAPEVAPEVVAPVAAIAEIDATETPAAEVGAPDDDAEGAETPAVIEAEAAEAAAAEAAAAEAAAAEAAIPAEADVSEADAFAASSGVWPEPPTPWVDTGAIAAVGAAVGAFDTPPVETPNEMSASDASATPDVSDLPTAVNTPQAETLQVDAPPPPSEEPPAYTPPPPVYVAPSQPVAGHVAPQARPQNTTPVIVEAILAFFGIYGVGWLISGETSIGVALLIAGFVWDAIFVAAAFTVIGLCCVVPLQLIFVALSAFQLNNRLRMRA
jgi:hypothetical protein